MTFTLAQRQDMKTFLTLICETMQRDGKIELDCGHYAMYGNSTQEIVLIIEEPEHYVAMCRACADAEGDSTYPTLYSCDDEWIPRDALEVEEIEETIRCNC
jgi:hypothetical protein